MVICEDLLFSCGARLESYHPNDFIFQEGTSLKYYLQIKSGTVKINNFMENGKEFVHGFPFDGHCIGESYLYTDNKYAVNAVAITKCEIIKIEKKTFLEILLKNPKLMLKLNRYTADRLHFRYIISTFLTISDPLLKLTRLLDYLKAYFGFRDKYTYVVPYTRQQLATLIGIRVETIIRTIKKMEKQKLLKIDSSKIVY